MKRAELKEQIDNGTLEDRERALNQQANRIAVESGDQFGWRGYLTYPEMDLERARIYRKPKPK